MVPYKREAVVGPRAGAPLTHQFGLVAHSATILLFGKPPPGYFHKILFKHCCQKLQRVFSSDAPDEGEDQDVNIFCNSVI